MKQASTLPDIYSAVVTTKSILGGWTDISAIATVLAGEIVGYFYVNTNRSITYAKIAKFAGVPVGVVQKRTQRMSGDFLSRPVAAAFDKTAKGQPDPRRQAATSQKQHKQSRSVSVPEHVIGGLNPINKCLAFNLACVIFRYLPFHPTSMHLDRRIFWFHITPGRNPSNSLAGNFLKSRAARICGGVRLAGIP